MTCRGHGLIVAITMAIALLISLSFPINSSSQATDVLVKDFMGKLAGEWDYQGGPGTSPLLRNNKFSWKATADIRESGGKILVTYWEAECHVLNIISRTYENCPGQITLVEDGRPVLSFSFETPSGWTITIKLKKNEQGEFEGIGRIGSLPATIIMRRVN